MSCITLKEADDRLEALQQSGAINLIGKINEALDLVKEAFTHGDTPRIAFSGGKDSLVVLDLVRRIRPDTIAVFCNTGNEYPETIQYVKTIENLTELHPEKGFWQCVKEYGLPQMKSKAKRHGNQCCFWLKEKPANDYYKAECVDLIFTGLTGEESRNRWMMLKRMGPSYYAKTEKLWKCHPIHNWTEKEVWDYIKLRNLEYNTLYDKGIPRCGCRFCTAYISWKERTARYNPRDTEILMNKAGYATLGDFI